jgi:hypothetical protein
MLPKKQHYTVVEITLNACLRSTTYCIAYTATYSTCAYRLHGRFDDLFVPLYKPVYMTVQIPIWYIHTIVWTYVWLQTVV